VTVGEDAVDDNIGDGRWRSTLPSGARTLRAAIQESNALADSNTVRLGRRTHRLTLPDRLAVTHRVRVMGATTTETVIDGMDRGQGTSPAISAGHPQVGPGVTTLGHCEVRDQARRIRQLTGDGRRCDIGSIEGR
jgi:hypothetical protein